MGIHPAFERALPETEDLSFKLDGQTLTAFEGETILEAAQRHGLTIPYLCYRDGYRPDGNCRACMVEIKGGRLQVEGDPLLAPSCVRKVEQGMEVVQSESARHSQKMVVELLLSDTPEQGHTQNSHLMYWARELGVAHPRFRQRTQPPRDLSHPAIAVNLDTCIQCGLCVRACCEEQNNDVIGMAGHGPSTRVVFDFDDPMGDSTCVGCGECVMACPTGAFMPALLAELAQT